MIDSTQQVDLNLIKCTEDYFYECISSHRQSISNSDLFQRLNNSPLFFNNLPHYRRSAVSVDLAQYGSLTISIFPVSVICQNCVIPEVPHETSSPLTNLENSSSHAPFSVSANPTRLSQIRYQEEYTTSVENQTHEELCLQILYVVQTQVSHPSL